MLVFKMSDAQDVQSKLKKALSAFESDSQMRHANYSLYVIDAKTGKVVIDRNSQIGLAPASCQKLFTSGAAFELLGHDYRYKTQLAYDGKINNGQLNGNIYIVGSGDPTLGSWRWKEMNDTVILNEWLTAVKKQGINNISGVITTNESKFSHQAIPDGWIWQDIGNYYGAGSYALNWKENQFDLTLTSGSHVGDKVQISDSNFSDEYVNELQSGPKGSGDNAYIYLSTESDRSKLLKGTIPINQQKFVISGANVNPPMEVLIDFSNFISRDRISSFPLEGQRRDQLFRDSLGLLKLNYFATHFSPLLDSMNFWFLRRSINLYGEAFIKTIALEKAGIGSTEKGVDLVKDFWAEQGIDKAAINIVDGSGLSPQNRVTTNALVKVLQYAKRRPWYNSFYLSLPTFNEMKMKSGSIGGARSFAGYHTSKDGHEYIFAIIVNNYDGSSSDIVSKMYKILDNLR
jgi:D-alanyl-D-alanine carboxypeptidase/D-alanyl-D-alanine-endopeptidase (penicillin-binding protein 4)